jgi:mRNA-decapping enzyme subunit 2
MYTWQVLEETGYDLTKQINPDDIIVVTIKEQRISLFIVPGVPEDFPFQTRTRKEISVCKYQPPFYAQLLTRNRKSNGSSSLICLRGSGIRPFRESSISFPRSLGEIIQTTV